MTTTDPTDGRSDDAPARAEYTWDSPAVPETAHHPVAGTSEAVVIHQPGAHPAPLADAQSGAAPWGIGHQAPAPEGHDPSSAAGHGYGQYAPSSVAPALHTPGPHAQTSYVPTSYVPASYAPAAADPRAVQPYMGPVAGPVVPYQQPVPSFQQTVVVVQQPKSVGISLLLTFFFGPFGMLYSTVTGFVVMFLVNLVVLPLTVGFGVLLTWPACMIWGAIAASNHNSRIAAATWTGPVGPPPQQPYQQPYQR